LTLPFAALTISVSLLASGCASSADDAENANASVRTLVDAESQTPTPTPTPEVAVERVEVTEPIPYTSSTIDDPGLDKGVQRVAMAGANGTKTIVFEVSSKDGVEISRTAVSESITVAPVNEVIAVGSKEKVAAPPPAPSGNCDANYDGACVPIASDVDCAGGSGNGPAYVVGPVRIVGSDVYDLDRDGDGIACD
jgi:hypothetical protein